VLGSLLIVKGSCLKQLVLFSYNSESWPVSSLAGAIHSFWKHLVNPTQVVGPRNPDPRGTEPKLFTANLESQINTVPEAAWPCVVLMLSGSIKNMVAARVVVAQACNPNS
jgi:hypothetical protein